MDLTNYTLKKKKELVDSLENLSDHQIFRRVMAQIILPFSKLDRMVLASNFSDFDWETRRASTGIILVKYAGYTTTGFLIYNALNKLG